MAITFPYPEQGTTTRASGEGCGSCVHSTYCPALYWLRRGCERGGEDLQPVSDANLGRRCASWSSSPADIVKSTPTTEDLAEEEYMYLQGIGQEANPSGMELNE